MGLLAGDTITAPGAPQVEVFAADGTWNRPNGVRSVIVEVVGGGGGSGGCAATGAGESAQSGGGGGGGYARKLITADDLDATVAVSIGDGGTAGASGANNGGTGGTSSFGTYCSATGGTGGGGRGASSAVQTAQGGNGGSATGGDINVPGDDGGLGRQNGITSYGNPFGGGSMLAGLTRGQANASAPKAGTGYGGGASGGTSAASTAARSGEVGSDGAVIVTTYF